MASLRVTFADIVAKSLVTALVIVIGGMPTWLFLLARYAFSPDGFWQNLVFGAAGIWLLGGLQFFLAVISLMVILTVWLS